MYEAICLIDNLYDGFRDVRSKSGWKPETQRYSMYMMPNLIELRDSLVNGTYRPTPPNGFIQNERGKPRWIESRCVNDRIVNKVVHDHEIMPAIFPKLIYDNAASIENRGTDFFRRRLLYHLSSFAAEHGTDGYILLIDFKKFFDNIRHDDLILMFRQVISDPRSMRLIEMMIRSNRVDVSYMSDEEYANCMNVPFNNLEYRQKIVSGEYKATGERFMNKYMGIGSQISQDAGIYYPHDIDNYCKIVRGVKGYGRYMDDSYAIHHSKEFLWDLLMHIKEICITLGIFLNEQKTQIVNLKHEFTILHTRYKLHENGDVSIIADSDSFSRERRKLNKQADMLNEGYERISYDIIRNQYNSWRGNIVRTANGRNIEPLQRMDNHFNELFIEPFANGQIII